MSKYIKIQCVEDSSCGYEDGERYQHIVKVNKKALEEICPNYRTYDQGEFFEMILVPDITENNELQADVLESKPLTQEECEKLSDEPIEVED